MEAYVPEDRRIHPRSCLLLLVPGLQAVHRVSERLPGMAPLTQFDAYTIRCLHDALADLGGVRPADAQLRAVVEAHVVAAGAVAA